MLFELLTYYYNNINHSFQLLALRIVCNKQLNWFIDEIIQKGGEGVILQKRGASYEGGRSHALLKLKVSYYLLLIYLLPFFLSFFYFFLYLSFFLFINLFEEYASRPRRNCC